jgi:hypothetical protein
MTDANSVSAAPLVADMAPYINLLVTALVGAAVTWFIALVNRWTGKEMAAADQAKLRQAAQDAAGMVFANAEAGISSVSIHASDPRIWAAVSKAVSLAPQIADITGFTPNVFAHMIVSELGRMQAQTSPSTPTSATTNVSAPAATVVAVDTGSAPAK